MSRAAVLPRDGHRLLLAPIADFANHASTFDAANAELRAEGDGSVSLVALRDISPGEEIHHCYAELNNENLLFSYGMVLDSNPNEGFMCPLHPPTTAVKTALLRQGLMELRHAEGIRGSLSDAPVLGHRGNPRELLFALQVQAMPEQMAASSLRRTAAS